MSEKKLTKEQIDYILSKRFGSQTLQPKLTPEQLIQKKIALNNLKDLQMGFDKKYMEDMFNEGVNSGAMPNTINQYMRYEFNGWIYEFKRFRKR